MSKPHRLNVELTLSAKEFQKLQMGLTPSSMDDKWFDYFEEDWLYMHRSWTGNQIFKCKVISESEEVFTIGEVYVERDKERYPWENKGGDESDVELFTTLIKLLTQRSITNPIYDGIMGLIVGDALGVPVEFVNRKELQANPVTTMMGMGTHNQPVGTWSDDTSLTLCLAENLLGGLNIQKLGQSFVDWLYDNKWTPHGEVFDVGNSTRMAIDRIKNGEEAEFAGNSGESSNGNGSLMRILPLFLETRKRRKDIERFQMIRKVSSITHAHIRSSLACFYYLEMANVLSDTGQKSSKIAYVYANHSFVKLTEELEINPDEVKLFERLTQGTIAELEEDQIFSSGYVLHTLEAAVWCLLRTNSYKEAVLKAVNLGEDTDTVAAVTGGLAGLLYGSEAIPEDWIQSLARLEDINGLLEGLSEE